jgi:hypothetical protein
MRTILDERKLQKELSEPLWITFERAFPNKR